MVVCILVQCQTKGCKDTAAIFCIDLKHHFKNQNYEIKPKNQPLNSSCSFLKFQILCKMCRRKQNCLDNPHFSATIKGFITVVFRELIQLPIADELVNQHLQHVFPVVEAKPWYCAHRAPCVLPTCPCKNAIRI